MKLEIRLNEEQLREIVHEAIEKFKNEMCGDCPYYTFCEEDEDGNSN